MLDLSLKNIVDPVSIIENYGADTARIFMLSDSPPERNLDWSNSGIEGSRKFLVKVWNFFNKLKFNNTNINKTILDESNYPLDLTKKLHFCIEKVTKNLDNFQYNVAVAALREFANYFFIFIFKDDDNAEENIVFEKDQQNDNDKDIDKDNVKHKDENKENKKSTKQQEQGDKVEIGDESLFLEMDDMLDEMEIID